MKSVRAFVVTVLCMMMVGAVAGTAAADTGRADTSATSSTVPGGDDSGWGLPRG
ncbi:hypothetical protein ACFS5L_22600 [Streptomyces phyllanthi]|uniref:hypothetical protein n=1 Tax=Streptomyces phyllanthi TaxID=1803180 RepID=UPI001883986C|nr:hypothetical protein [Streptomyces phyllanthi]